MVPVTVVEAGPCVVTRVRTAEKDGYTAVQLGFGAGRPAQGQQAARRLLRASTTSPRAVTSSSSVPTTRATTPSGQELRADTFEAGQLVDVTGKSKGKGFAGVMKRHGFKGLGASHGAQRKHRSPGSIGGCATPGRVFKGMRMAGRMGNVRTTVQSLTGPRRGRREGPAPDQGCDPRRQGRPGPGPHRRQEGGCQVSTIDVLDVKGEKAGTVDLPEDIFDDQGQHAADPPGRRAPSSPRAGRAPTRRRPAARSAAAAGSRTARRAPAAPARARPARRSSPAVASSTARSRATTRSGPPRR